VPAKDGRDQYRTVNVVMNEGRWFLIAAIFGIVSTILIASWAYGGQLMPDKPAQSASAYDQAGFYVEVGLWLLAAVTGSILAWGVWRRLSRRD
jgi:hypothetical protein